MLSKFRSKILSKRSLVVIRTRSWKVLSCLVVGLSLGMFFNEALQAGAKSYLRSYFGSRKYNYEETTLEHIREHPHAYRNVYVQFTCRYNRRVQSYNPVWTRFNSERYVAFSVWGLPQDLWMPKEQSADFPFLFVPKTITSVSLTLETLNELKKYETIRVYGLVDAVFTDIPWIQVDGMEIVGEPRLTDEAIYHIRTALKYQSMDRHDLATQAFVDVLQYQLPKDIIAKVKKLRGRSYYLSNEYDVALDDFSDALSVRAQTDATLHRWMAEVQIAVADYKTALDHLYKGLIIQGADAHARALMGRCYFELKQYAQGLRECEKALIIDKKNAESYWYIGKIYRAIEDFEKARQNVLQSIELDERNPEVHRELGEILIILGDYDLAIREFKACVNDTEGQFVPLYHWLLGDAYDKAGKLYEAAASMTRSTKLDSTYVPGHLGAGRVYARLAQYDKAIAAYSEVIKLDPAIEEAYLAVGKIHLEQAAPLLAVKTYEAGVEAIDDSQSLYSRLGTLQYQLDNVKAAEEALDEAVKLDDEGKDLDARYLLGLTCLQTDQTSRARGHLAYVSEQRPNQAEVWVNLGVANARLKDFEEAEDAYTKAINLNPDDAFAVNNLAFLYLKQDKQLARGLELSLIAFKIDPLNTMVQDTLGWAYYKNGQIAQAIKVLQSAQQTFPNNETACHLGLAFIKTGQINDAKALLEPIAEGRDDVADLAKSGLDEIEDIIRERERAAQEAERNAKKQRPATPKQDQDAEPKTPADEPAADGHAPVRGGRSR